MKKKAFEILYEDDYLIAIDKRAGVLSIPDRYHEDKENIYTLMTHYHGKIFSLHRLDKETSGVLIYAKDAETHRLLNEQFENRTVEKIYLAMVEGNPSPPQDTIETLLAISPNKKNIVVVDKKGKKAITSYKVIEAYQDFSLLEVNLQTGRQHQIRVHMQHLGHPLAVDKKYGHRDVLFAYDIKGKSYRPNRYNEPRPLISRHTLHAQKITITHPKNGQRQTFEASLPKDLKALITQLRKWRS